MLKALWNFLVGNSADENSKSTAAAKPGAAVGGSLRDLEGFVSYVVCALVDNPGEVKIRTEETEDGAAIRISCRKEDIGKVVGKRGKTIMAIRSLVSGAAGRQRKRVSVEVLD